MSDALLGVLAGGIITLFANYLSFKFQLSQWKTNKKIELLQERREELAKSYKEITRILTSETDFAKAFVEITEHAGVGMPENVLNTMSDYITTKSEQTEENKDPLMYEARGKIIVAMKIAIDDLDKKIENSLK